MSAMPTEEIDFLYVASHKLSNATTPAEQLDAVSDYARTTGAMAGQLFYMSASEDTADLDANPWIEFAAEWTSDEQPLLGVGKRVQTPMTNFAQTAMTQPVRPILVSDVSTDSRVDADTQTNFAQLGIQSLVQLPLNSKGRWVGAIAFMWDRPKQFTRRDERIYQALLQQVTPVIDSVRLLAQIHDRYIAEQEARRELEILYAASEALNAANSLEETLMAIFSLPIQHPASLAIFENFDQSKASSIDLYQLSKRSSAVRWERVKLVDLPIAQIPPDTHLLDIENVLTDPRLDPLSQAFYIQRRAFSTLIVVLKQGERCLGGLTFFASSPNAFTEQDRRMAVGIGKLVVTAVERRRLYIEAESARQRAELLSQVNASLSKATDEASILSAVAQYTQPIGVNTMMLLYADVDESTLVARSIPAGIWREGRALSVTDWFPPSDDRPMFESDWWVEGFDRIVYIENTADDPRVTEEQQHLFRKAYDAQACAAILLRTAGRTLALLSVFWAEPHQFSAEEKDMFSQIMQTLASVITSRRAYLAEKERARQLQAVANVSAVATGILNEQELLRTISDLTSHSFDDLHFMIYLLDPTGRYLVQRTGAAAENEVVTVDNWRLVIDMESQTSLATQAANTRQIVIEPDIKLTDRPFTLMIPDARSEMAVPLIAANTVFGVLSIQSSEINRFTDSDKLVMTTLADLIAVAIQNARLYQQAQEIATYQERNRLARELHDSVSQALYGVSLGAQTARILLDIDPTRLREPLDYVLSLAEAGLTEMRALIFDLRPESVEQEGLIAALQKQTASLRARHGIDLETEFCPEPSIPLKTKEALYWMVREALHNIMKHAQASRVTVQVQKVQQNLFVKVTDNGVGFDTAREFPGHLGLRSMRERASKLGGHLEIASQPNEGTTIQISVPLRMTLV